ncbi:hypothetical protein [Hoeflea sp.]|uniref:hypothetical protein n=1 Tax=Hoeflea sp. TaxID=1940281 RepID=UPI003A8E16E4
MSTEQETPDGWPKGSIRMSFDEIGKLGVQPTSNELLWNGKVLATKKQVSLRGFELFLAFVVAVGTVAGAAYPYLKHFGLI